MHTRVEARRRLLGHVQDLRRLIDRVQRRPSDPVLGASVAALGERITHDLLSLYALREQGADPVLRGIVQPALEVARDALRMARARPDALARTLETAASALTRAA